MIFDIPEIFYMAPSIVNHMPDLRIVYLVDSKSDETGLFANVVSSLFSSLLGAGFGAYGAWRFSNYDSKTRDIESEIRATNIAISHARVIIHGCAIFSKQVFKNKFEKYMQDRKEYSTNQSNSKKVRFENTDKFLFSLEEFTKRDLPVSELKNICTTRLNLTPRGFYLANLIPILCFELNHFIEKRNDLIKELQRNNSNAYERYFGLKYMSREENIVEDTRYYDSMNTVKERIDDILKATSLLIDDVIYQGEENLKKSTIKNRFLKIQYPDLEKYSDIIPSDKNYADWLEYNSGFNNQTKL